MRKLILVVSVLLLAACGNKEATDSENQNLIHVKNSTIEEVDRDSGQKIAKHLVELATGLPNITDASAVVIGKYAIVGIDVKSNVERSTVGSIKYSVAEALKNDPHGARAIVIADPDMTARLKEVQEDIKDGKPIQGIMTELADIAGRLMPEIPGDIIEPKHQDSTDKPKNKLNQKDKHNLEEEQQDQSQHHKD
jgi:YhcN/YlaJ family sporulation lipoprotein